jgi:hypothetical protein
MMKILRLFRGGCRGSGRGQSFVELALTLPFVLALTMGVVDLGFILYAHVQVAAAAGEGAIVGSRFTVSGDASDNGVTWAGNDALRNAAIRTRVTQAMGRLNITSPHFTPGSDITITYHPTTATSLTRTGEEMTVTVSYRQSLVFDFMPNAGSLTTVSTSTRTRIQ